MPNWIEGTIKLRGSYEDLKRFVNEGLEPITIVGKQVGKKEDLIDFTDYGSEFEFKINDDMWISGTRRAFASAGLYGTSTGNDDNLILVLNVKQAWAFLANDDNRDKWKSISDKFNLDIRLYGYEMGMEFCEEVIILRGKGIVLDNVIQFEDWNWDCPFPLLGG